MLINCRVSPDLILQAFSHFTYVTAHSDSPSFQSLHLRHSSLWFSKLSVTSPTSQLILILQAFRFHLRHNSFSNPSLALPMSQLIVQPFRCFTYVTAHSPTLLTLYVRHNSFSNPSVAWPTSQLILQTHPRLYLRHNSLSNPSVASPTSQFILQTFFRLSYVTGFSVTSPGEPPMRPAILHSTLFSVFLFESAYSPFIMMLSIWCVLLPRTFFPFTIPSRASFSRQFFLSQVLTGKIIKSFRMLIGEGGVWPVVYLQNIKCQGASFVNGTHFQQDLSSLQDHNPPPTNPF